MSKSKGKITAESLVASAWAAALSPQYEFDEVPPGWFTRAQISESLGKNRSTVARRMQDAVIEGRAEVKIFRIASGQRGIYPVPHYRIK
jgi:hypothetical protein